MASIHAEHEARRNMIMQELGRQIGVISEAATCSCWARRIEDELPPVLSAAAASGRPAHYSGTEISPIYAEWLVSMAGELGHWVRPGPGVAYVPHTPHAGLSGTGGGKTDRSPAGAEPAS